MGGPGSGNHWSRCDRKTTVEECLSIDVSQLARDGILRAGARGILTYATDGRTVATTGLSTRSSEDGELVLLLTYRWRDAEDIAIPIRLQTTRPHFGGLRWWFTCPLVIDGVACNRRVAKLYLYDRYFGCRTCHDLTYASCQGRDWSWAGIDRRIGRLRRRVDALRRRNRTA